MFDCGYLIQENFSSSLFHFLFYIMMCFCGTFLCYFLGTISFGSNNELCIVKEKWTPQNKAKKVQKLTLSWKFVLLFVVIGVVKVFFFIYRIWKINVGEKNKRIMKHIFLVKYKAVRTFFRRCAFARPCKNIREILPGNNCIIF